MSFLQQKMEVMQTIEKSMNQLMEKYLKPIETIWQPSDFLPDARDESFMDEINEIQELAKELSTDLMAVLVGDTITEEALPTYEAWLMGMDGTNQEDRNNGWAKWVRAWTAEENRHGDLLNKYLYLSKRVDMREFEVTTHHLINDGFAIHTGSDPYKNFIYTSFQEMATNVSHRRVATLAKKTGNHRLAKICGVIAADENRHANAYQEFVRRIFELDPNGMMDAFLYMMKKKIVMPAHFLRESGQDIGALWGHFSDTAQRINVYTTDDYVDIFNSLLKTWDLEGMTGLNDSAEKARDYIMKLPARLQRISERIVVPEVQYRFKWIV